MRELIHSHSSCCIICEHFSSCLSTSEIPEVFHVCMLFTSLLLLLFLLFFHTFVPNLHKIGRRRRQRQQQMPKYTWWKTSYKFPHAPIPALSFTGSSFWPFEKKKRNYPAWKMPNSNNTWIKWKTVTTICEGIKMSDEEGGVGMFWVYPQKLFLACIANRWSVYTKGRVCVVHRIILIGEVTRNISFFVV